MISGPRAMKASWMSSRISQRIRSRPNQCGSAMVCSITQRWTPRPEPCPAPRRAIIGFTPVAQTSRRYLSWSYPLSAYSTLGRRRGRPRRPRTGGIDLSSGTSWVTSLRLPPIRLSAPEGCRCRRRSRDVWSPSSHGRPGSDPFWAALQRPDVRAVNHRELWLLPAECSQCYAGCADDPINWRRADRRDQPTTGPASGTRLEGEALPMSRLGALQRGVAVAYR